MALEHLSLTWMLVFVLFYFLLPLVIFGIFLYVALFDDTNELYDALFSMQTFKRNLFRPFNLCEKTGAASRETPKATPEKLNPPLQKICINLQSKAKDEHKDEVRQVENKILQTDKKGKRLGEQSEDFEPRKGFGNVQRPSAAKKTCTRPKKIEGSFEPASITKAEWMIPEKDKLPKHATRVGQVPRNRASKIPVKSRQHPPTTPSLLSRTPLRQHPPTVVPVKPQSHALEAGSEAQLSRPRRR